MEDLMNRCATILAGAPVATWALAHQMSSNGYAHAGNPAWVLVSTVRWLCTVIVITTIAMFIIKAVAEREFELARQREEAEKRRQETKLNEERRKQWEIEYTEDSNMKTQKLKPQSLESLAKDWGIDYQVFKIKLELIDAIKDYCTGHHVSQRKLASMVHGLTQDRHQEWSVGWNFNRHIR